MKYKTIALFLAPVFILLAACIYFNVSWPYYFAAWFIGLIFGLLATLARFWFTDNKPAKMDLKRTWMNDDDGNNVFMS